MSVLHKKKKKKGINVALNRVNTVNEDNYL